MDKDAKFTIITKSRDYPNTVKTCNVPTGSAYPKLGDKIIALNSVTGGRRLGFVTKVRAEDRQFMIPNGILLLIGELTKALADVDDAQLQEIKKIAEAFRDDQGLAVCPLCEGYGLISSSEKFGKAHTYESEKTCTFCSRNGVVFEAMLKELMSSEVKDEAVH